MKATFKIAGTIAAVVAVVTALSIVTSPLYGYLGYGSPDKVK